MWTPGRAPAPLGPAPRGGRVRALCWMSDQYQHGTILLLVYYVLQLFYTCLVFRCYALLRFTAFLLLVTTWSYFLTTFYYVVLSVGNVHIEGLGGLQNEPGKNETLGKRSRSNSRTFKRLMRKLTNFHSFS